MFRKKRRYNLKELYPDEIFLDSTNLPKFNLHQFEGRIEKPIGKRSAYLTFAAFSIIAAIFFVQATVLQVVRGEEYFEISQNNHLQLTPIFADRGIIEDRFGKPLAWNEIGEDPADFTLRKYIETPGFGHLLGYVSYPAKDKFGVYYRSEFIGHGGVEETFNEELSGEHGIQITERNALMQTVSGSVQKAPRAGDNLVLSIDARLQTKLYDIIARTVNGVHFRGGSGILMNAKTGEILAITSYPEYNPQIFTDAKDTRQIRAILNDPAEPFLNRPISGLFTPGSIVKPYMAMAALNEKIISPDKKILSTGALRLPNPYYPGRYTLFNDWKAHGWVDMRRAIAVSSNVYFYTIGGGFEDQKGLGIRNIEKYARMFGIGEKTGVNLVGEKDGIIPNPEWKEKNFEDGTWRIGDTYHTAIGQYGFQVTPIQMIRAVAGIANDGKLPTPTILKTDKESKMETLDLRKEDFKIVKEGMRLGALEGSAAGLNVPYVKVAAKTGTAEIGATKAYVNSWVMGFFPYDDPQYVFIISMERGPRKNLIGGVSVMRQLLDYMRWNTPEYFGLPPVPEKPIETFKPVDTPVNPGPTLPVDQGNQNPSPGEATPPVITQPNEVDPAPEPETNPPVTNPTPQGNEPGGLQNDPNYGNNSPITPTAF